MEWMSCTPFISRRQSSCPSSPLPFPGRYYQFGGSTNVLVLPPNTVTFDADLVVNSKAGVETWVPMGDHIGMRHTTNAR